MSNELLPTKNVGTGIARLRIQPTPFCWFVVAVSCAYGFVQLVDQFKRLNLSKLWMIGRVKEGEADSRRCSWPRPEQNDDKKEK